ncbi:type II toxin-antitoxin system Phd/YefM family antitoxin [Streptomyces mayteni]
MTDSLSIRELPCRLAEVVAKAEQGDPTVLTRDGVPVAAMVPVEAFHALEAAADELLAREAARVLGEEGAGPTYTMAQVVADLMSEVQPRTR